MSKLRCALVALALAIVAASGAQEIGKVNVEPNPTTGILYADIPARPPDTTLQIMRQGQLISKVKVVNSDRPGIQALEVPKADLNKIRVGDEIALAPTANTELPSLTAALPAAAPAGAALTPPPLSNVIAPPPPESIVVPPASDAPGLPSLAPLASPTPNGSKPLREEGLAAPVAPPPIYTPAPAPPAYTPPPPPPTYVPAPPPAAPRLTPRGATVAVYPAPAVAPKVQAGILGPYGPGLAAAAPVGTPYLRSPAFAGPPVIYMPQTVTRVLLPGATPYPANMMYPPAQYVYASAPFTRTDLYVDLPYGTFYWPQGYAGTAPVEPQVPAYVMAPSAAITSNEASYAVQRYAPGVGHPETVSPISEGVAPEPGAPATSVVAPAPPPTAGLPETGMFPGIVAEQAEAAVAPALAVTPVTGLEAALAPAPAVPEAITPFAPDANLAAAATPAPGAAMPGIEVDDAIPGALLLDPPNAWLPSHNPVDSFRQSSLVAPVDGEKVKTATFVANIAEEGEYEVYLWWVASNPDFRSASVPVTINTATGAVKTTINQTQNGRQWNLLGTYPFKAGQQQQILTISTEGVNPGPTMNVSVDAMKLVKVR